ncbi:MAG: class I SAM-dependent methyltransferase [Eubacteriales bacterium]|nr:class I SAM-dependent methyltransferase [Eubacteriales bacterium]
MEFTIQEQALAAVEKAGLRLEMQDDVLVLTDGKLTVSGDFSKMLPRLKQNNLQREMLVKAARIKSLSRPLRIVDATAGLGEDAILLAASGHQVCMFEYDPVIAALLKDALRRAALHPQLSEIAARMRVLEGDSTKALPQMAALPEEERPDVVLLDPMFPERKKSGLIKKKFQLLQQLESPCSAEEELLQAAIAAEPLKIVIKRPAKGPYLAGRKPDYSLDGKAIRYDCLINVGLKKQ